MKFESLDFDISVFNLTKTVLRIISLIDITNLTKMYQVDLRNARTSTLILFYIYRLL